MLPGTWIFKLKRLPIEYTLKFNARYYVQGDNQTEGVDYFETSAPVINWSTVRLSQTFILSNLWHTKQVGYTNEFSQADLKEQVFFESPIGLIFKYGKDRVLKLIKRLHGLKQAPQVFFETSGVDLSNEGLFNPKWTIYYLLNQS